MGALGRIEARAPARAPISPYLLARPRTLRKSVQRGNPAHRVENPVGGWSLNRRARGFEGWEPRFALARANLLKTTPLPRRRDSAPRRGPDDPTPGSPGGARRR